MLSLLLVALIELEMLDAQRALPQIASQPTDAESSVIAKVGGLGPVVMLPHCLCNEPLMDAVLEKLSRRAQRGAGIRNKVTPRNIIICAVQITDRREVK